MRPHHPTPEAIELTEGEKDKIMNDFLLPPLDFSKKTANDLLFLKLGLSTAYERCEGLHLARVALKELAKMVEDAERDFEGQQLPWKE